MYSVVLWIPTFHSLVQLLASQSSEKMLLLFSMTNCTATFLECMSVISLSRLWSRIIVGANTTAKFFGDI